MEVGPDGFKDPFQLKQSCDSMNIRRKTTSALRMVGIKMNKFKKITSSVDLNSPQPYWGVDLYSEPSYSTKKATIDQFPIPYQISLSVEDNGRFCKQSLWCVCLSVWMPQSQATQHCFETVGTKQRNPERLSMGKGKEPQEDKTRSKEESL